MAFHRRKILITGGTSGIGHALARKLSLRHDIMVTGRKAESEVRETLPDSCLYVEADHGDPAAAAKAIAGGLLKAGWVKLDNAVLNAGTGYAAQNGIDEITRIRETLDVNLASPVLLSRALFPWLAKAGGTLTLIGSVAHKGQAQFPAYAASKGALHGFARALRAEWQGQVAVQVLHPGPTRTDMHEKAGHDPGRMRTFFFNPDDMADMISSAMASRKSPVTLGYRHYFSGAASLGRRL